MKYVIAIILGALLVFLFTITLAMLHASLETGNPLALLVGLMGAASLYWIVRKQLPKLERHWDEGNF